jgi:hypothetical protein
MSWLRGSGFPAGERGGSCAAVRLTPTLCAELIASPATHLILLIMALVNHIIDPLPDYSPLLVRAFFYPDGGFFLNH